MLQPVFVERHGRTVIVVPMGENGHLPKSDPADNTEPIWQGMVYGIDPDTGEEIWSFAPPPWKSRTGSCRASKYWSGYLPACWASPTVDTQGHVYVPWMGGIAYILEGATGRVVSRYDMGCTVTGC